MNHRHAKHPKGNSAHLLLQVSDAGLARYYFFQGFVATFAVLYPFFGRAFDVFGYHNRVVSTVLILIVIVISIPRFSCARARHGLGALVLGLIALAVLYADPVQRGELFHVQFETGYYEGKLARLFQLSVPVFVLGYLVSSSRVRSSFIRGSWWAIFVSGLIGLGILITHRQYFLGQTCEISSSFQEQQLFSTIGLSIVLTLATILVLDTVPWTGRDYLWAPWCGLLMVLSVLLLRQRAHLIVICLLVLARFWNKRRRLASLAAVAIVFGVAVGMVIKHYRELVITETVQLYWAAAADGRMVRGRTDLAALAIAGIRENTLGHGLGAFDVHHCKPYPHNRFLEAFYELGIGGAVCVGWMCVLGLRRLPGLFTAQQSSRASPSLWFLHAAVVFLLAHELKAGSLECISIYIYFLFITPTVSRLGDLRGQTTVPLRAHAPGIHGRSTARPRAGLPPGQRILGRPC
jgi:hypothetical protein